MATAKFLYVILGLLFVAIGAIGAVLPILPTTPFLLLALFCFSRGSERWNNWFIGTKLYKKYLNNYVESRTMTLKQKICILLFADAMLAFPLIMVESLLVKLMIVVIIIIKYWYFFFVIKTAKPGDTVLLEGENN